MATGLALASTKMQAHHAAKLMPARSIRKGPRDAEPTAGRAGLQLQGHTPKEAQEGKHVAKLMPARSNPMGQELRKPRLGCKAQDGNLSATDVFYSQTLSAGCCTGLPFSCFGTKAKKKRKRAVAFPFRKGTVQVDFKEDQSRFGSVTSVEVGCQRHTAS